MLSNSLSHYSQIHFRTLTRRGSRPRPIATARLLAGGATECIVSARDQITRVCKAIFAVETLRDVYADLVLTNKHAVDV